MQKIVMRLICTGQHHQLAQFAVPPDAEGKPKAPELAPITDVRMVAQAKKDGTEDINHPVWRDAPNATFDIKFAQPEVMAECVAGREFIVTIEAAPEKAEGTVN